jgi:hypothetical protein
MHPKKILHGPIATIVVEIPLRVTFNGLLKLPIMLSQMMVPTAKLHMLIVVSS